MFDVCVKVKACFVSENIFCNVLNVIFLSSFSACQETGKFLPHT